MNSTAETVQCLKNSIRQDRNFSSQQKTWILVVIRVMLGLVTFATLRCGIHAWMAAPKLAKFLTEQAEYEKLMNSHSQAGRNENKIQKEKLWLQFRLTSLAVIALVLFAPFVRVVTVAIENSDSLGYTIYTFLICTASVVHLFLWELVNDSIALLCFRVVASSADMVTEDIQWTCKWQRPSASKIACWKRLVFRARNNCQLLCAFVGFSEVIMLFECVARCTLCIFLVSVLPWDSPSVVPALLLWSFFACFLLLRIVVKAWAAEKVAEAGKKQLREIIRIEADNRDLAAKLQIDMTQEALSVDPIEIRLYGVPLRRGIFVVVLGNLANYLIGLFQFWLSIGRNQTRDP